MGISVSRTSEPIRFDVGIGSAGYADVIDSPAAGRAQKSLLPGSTTVSQAIDELFPLDGSVVAEVMGALVEGNSASLRTPGGFAAAAQSAAAMLRGAGTDASARAADEIDELIADTDLFERCRMALLET